MNQQTVITSSFADFSIAVENHFNEMSQHELYVVDSDRDTIVETYLSAFPEGTNPIFRTNTEHDCSCCKQFIRGLGNVVAIIDGNLVSVWDIPGIGYPYNIVAAKMAEYIKSLPIRSVFRTQERSYGAAVTHELIDGHSHAWNHFVGRVADRHYDRDADATRGRVNSVHGVLRRGLETLTADALTTVLELIDSNAIYRGAEFRKDVAGFLNLQAKYLAAADKTLFVWEHVKDRNARFRNTVVGTLVQDLSDGVDLERAVKSFETKVAPQNYKRPTALITPRMVEAAMGTIRELDLESALQRRHAKFSDVSVNNVLFVDNAVRGQMQDSDLTALLMEEAVSAAPNLDNAPCLSINDFITHVLPGATSMELLVENSMLNNFASLTAPVFDGNRLFKWGNSFAWSYDGNVADSVKQRVKAAGGRVDARFRVSLGWYNHDDLDIHVYEPDGNLIYYGNKSGKLDVDMNAGGRMSREPVENVCWDRLKDGDYKVVIHNFTRRESIDVGFELDVEFDGVPHKFFYPKPVRGEVKALAFKVKGGKVVQMGMGDNAMEAGSISQEKWGIRTETLVKVNTMVLSPNHWDEQFATGNKHWFFILDGCHNPEPVRGIYNEFLRPDLEQHRKVFEVLGDKTKCQPTPDQLSGLGFSSTREGGAKVIVDRRPYNIQF
ncbi:hypothetical protein MHM88_14630 [Epibacterium sp. MM17-32]|uniref:hypothetical protein n=1 Tax=Epibacterium sp. MM17-32 TaxID=2917734 RepID=UPI001EF659E7|nr:hypothetical protein [Epibacterium sp. MM17-32]MCG7629044.1 hypothetical protein [Epibacterium sp. MM17-32]